VTSCNTEREEPIETVRAPSKTPFDGAEETWVQRVIADGVASCSHFSEIGQDSLGCCALEDSPGCYWAVTVTAENIGILVQCLRQRDRWTATLMALVVHGSSLIISHRTKA
jgi:hypothetical protein